MRDEPLKNAPSGVHFSKFTQEEINRAFNPPRKSAKIKDKTKCRVCQQSHIVTKGMCEKCSVKAGLEYIRSAGTHKTIKRSDISRRLGAIKNRAKKYEVPFNLTTDYYMKLWVEQEGKCALTGRPMTHGQRLGTSLDNASLDRIHSGLGYVEGNVRLVTYQANSARGIGNDQDLFEFCEDVMSWFMTANNRLRREMK